LSLLRLSIVRIRVIIGFSVHVMNETALCATPQPALFRRPRSKHLGIYVMNFGFRCGSAVEGVGHSSEVSLPAVAHHSNWPHLLN
jgi:hypothetical protein